MKARRAIVGGAALAAGLAGAMAVGGCGAASTIDPVAHAAEITSQLPGARITLSEQISSGALPGPITISGDGYVDERRRAGMLNLDLSRIPFVSALGGSKLVQVVFQYPVIYMNFPFLASRLPEGKSWMKINIEQTAKAAGIDLSQLSSFDRVDPTQFLSYLRASSGGVTNLATETVDGVSTTHYRANLQFARILERLPAAQRAGARTSLERLGMSSSIPIDVWIDGLHRVRRERLAYSGAPAGTPVGASVTIDYTSFGSVPPITPPPAGKVYDLTALAAAGIKTGAG
jgi:hypothetical protein